MTNRQLHSKTIGRHHFSHLHTLKTVLVRNWCLKRSRMIYAVASRVLPGDMRINIAMRCREDTDKDWGHAWVTRNGTPFLESDKHYSEKAKTKIAETGKYIYWIYN